MTGFKLVVALSVIFLGQGIAFAQAKTPREQAKEHFNKGFAYYQAGQYLKAVRELKTAYKIRPVPLVLFYVAKTYKAAGLNEEAITYFRKFLDEARLTDPKRKEALAAIKAMGGTVKAPPGAVTPTVTPRPTPGGPTPRPTVTPTPTKPKRRVKPGEIIHDAIEEARPGMPLLLEAELPDEIEWARLYLYFRTPGMEKFIKKLMKPGRRGIYSYLIHRMYLRGKSLQYYIEAVGRTGKRVAGSGTATSPNIVLLSADAPMQPGGRMDDSASAPGKVKGTGPEPPPGVKIPTGPGKPTAASRWTLYGAVGLSVATVALLASGIALGVSARYRAQDMADRGTAKLPAGWVYPPDRVFTSDLKSIQDQGKAYDIGAIVCYALSAAAAGGATYFWLRYFNVIGGSSERAAPAPKPPPQPASITPMVGKGLVGVSYGAKF